MKGLRVLAMGSLGLLTVRASTPSPRNCALAGAALGAGGGAWAGASHDTGHDGDEAAATGAVGALAGAGLGYLPCLAMRKPEAPPPKPKPKPDPEVHNQRLSQRRADAVLDYLIPRGVPASALSASGLGESRPIAPNESREGRALNRRVEPRLAQ